MNKKEQGFTLIELMIVVAIVAILAAIALPSYSAYVTKSNRADAKVALMKYAQMQESYYVQNMSYAKDLKTGAGGLGLGTTTTVASEEGLYSIALSAVTPAGCDGTSTKPCTGYTLEATPVSGGRQATDSLCTGFRINQLGVREAKAGTGTYSPAQGKQCW